MTIVADARWLVHALLSVLGWSSVLLVGVWMLAGPWWALLVAGIVLSVAVLVWRVIR